MKPQNPFRSGLRNMLTSYSVTRFSGFAESAKIMQNFRKEQSKIYQERSEKISEMREMLDQGKVVDAKLIENVLNMNEVERKLFELETKERYYGKSREFWNVVAGQNTNPTELMGLLLSLATFPDQLNKDEMVRLLERSMSCYRNFTKTGNKLSDLQSQERLLTNMAITCRFFIDHNLSQINELQSGDINALTQAEIRLLAKKERKNFDEAKSWWSELMPEGKDGNIIDQKDPLEDFLNDVPHYDYKRRYAPDSTRKDDAEFGEFIFNNSALQKKVIVNDSSKLLREIVYDSYQKTRNLLERAMQDFIKHYDMLSKSSGFEPYKWDAAYDISKMFDKAFRDGAAYTPMKIAFSGYFFAKAALAHQRGDIAEFNDVLKILSSSSGNVGGDKRLNNLLAMRLVKEQFEEAKKEVGENCCDSFLGRMNLLHEFVMTKYDEVLLSGKKQENGSYFSVDEFANLTTEAMKSAAQDFMQSRIRGEKAEELRKSFEYDLDAPMPFPSSPTTESEDFATIKKLIFDKDFLAFCEKFGEKPLISDYPESALDSSSLEEALRNLAHDTPSSSTSQPKVESLAQNQETTQQR